MTFPSPRGGGLRLPRPPFAAVLALAILAMAALWAVAAPSSHAEDGNGSYAVSQGQALFQKGCASCHGLNSEGSPQGPSLIGVGAAAVDFQVATGRMPLGRPGPEAERGKPKYSQTEIDQLSAYVASLAPGPERPVVDTSQGNVVAGGQLFRLNCAQCHNAAGAGGALTYGKYAPELKPSTAVQVVEAMRTGPENMPVFGPGQLNAQQATDIAAYVVTVTKSQDPGGHGIGRLGPVPEGIVIWTVGIGAVIAFTFWIGARS
ncbi:MAG: cytochrome c class [Mycobacterium sp.]|nr:cytochrome c class [Mycobacterium sp.]